MYSHKVLIVFGTRPEAIKMAPVIHAFKDMPHIDIKVCVTGQHQELLTPILSFFKITPDFNLNVMQSHQSLSDLSAKILTTLSNVLRDFSPDMLLVHGDTTTTFISSLAAFYFKIPVAHVEAGLRTGNIYSPWPEEANRKLTASIAKLHFAPTVNAKQNLINEGIHSDAIHVTGNTVIDALECALKNIKNDRKLQQSLQKKFPFIKADHKFILVTGHRRENFGDGFKKICTALQSIATTYPKVDIIYPVHLNPNVQKPVNERLSKQHNILLIDPLDYLSFVFLMQHCCLILTDSGGVQEEAPTLGKPVLVMRDHSERIEAIEAGVVELVGTNPTTIFSAVSKILNQQLSLDRINIARNPYGDGKAAIKIVEHIEKMLITSQTGVDSHSKLTEKEEVTTI